MYRSPLYRWWVRRIWARHNRSPPIRRAINDVLQYLKCSDGIGLNVGCGATNLHPQVLRLDLDPLATPDSIASVDSLPFQDNSFSLVLSQEVLEHVPNPRVALSELVRVLKPGGVVYIQTPFIIGYHAAPADYWRFTNEGLKELLLEQGLNIERLEPSVGAGTGLYRIVVEFSAVLGARFASPLYLPTKAVSAVMFAPLRWMDRWLLDGPQRWRVAGGCLAIARKTA